MTKTMASKARAMRHGMIRRIFGNRKSITKQGATDLLIAFKESWLPDHFKQLEAAAKRGELSPKTCESLETVKDWELIRKTICATARAVLRSPAKSRKTTPNSKRNPK